MYIDVFIEKMTAAFAVQASHIFSTKYSGVRDIYICNFNEALTNDVISFEQLGPAVLETHHKFQEEFLAESVEIFESLILQYFIGCILQSQASQRH